MEIAFCFGSNLGDRMQILRQAKILMLEYPDAHPLAQSGVYETEPVGVKEEYQHLPYLNAVLVIESTETPETWLKRLQTVEVSLGRVRQEDRYAPRTLDIDILYCGDAVIDSGGLQVPHPRWAERRFVVKPLAEVRPDKRLPRTGQTVAELLDGLKDDKDVTLLTKDW